MKPLTVGGVKSLFPNAPIKSYERNQIICYPGDKPDLVYFVVEGHVRMYDIDKSGSEKILHINGPRNIFPMLYTFDITKEVTTFYATINKVKLLTIPIDEFRRQSENNHEFSKSLMTWFLGEIEEQGYRLNALEKTDARSKVLYALKSLIRHHSTPAGEWRQIDFPITRQFIADYTGLARETVSITMAELEKDQIIRKAGLKMIEVKASALPQI